MIEAFIYSFIIYVIYVILFGSALPLEWTGVAGPDHAIHYSVNMHRWRLLSLLVLVCMLGFTWGALNAPDALFSFLRKLRLTTRTSHESVWNDVLNTQSGWVQVGLTNGRELIGWIRRYSDQDGDKSLFLVEAAWVKEDGSTAPVTGPGILLTEKAGIESVMFLDAPGE